METGTIKLPAYLDAQLKDLQTGESHASLLTAKPANVWLFEASQRPVPKMLFGEFWYEGEVCVLFSDSNLGKSILAVQIAAAIASGRSVGYFDIETDPQKVLYCDFELSDMQFAIRYSERDGDFCKNIYEFSPNLVRAEINPHSELPPGFLKFEDFLGFSLEQAIVANGIGVVIVDNITYLRDEAEKAKEAISLMKFLQNLASKLGISLLALAHTPKRDVSKPLSKNDLGGSRMVYNFCDSCFAVGESQKDSGLRYLKQIKVRNAAFRYGSSNVAICQIVKPSNFTGFEFLEFADENDHLKKLSKRDKDDLDDRIRQLDAQGYSLREIEKMTGCSKSTVARRLGKD